MALSKEFVDMLCCPICKESIEQDENGEYLICKRCKVKYPIKDNIPILIIGKEIKIEDKDV